MNTDLVLAFVNSFKEWASERPDIQAAALVGSHARGTATGDSDVDLVVVAKEPRRYLDDTAWADFFGNFSDEQVEDYGPVTSLRVWYDAGLEVEFALAEESWAAVPLDEGTRSVIEGGMRVLFDREGLLAGLDEPS